MSRKSRISFEIKVKYVQECLTGKGSLLEIYIQYNISSDSVLQRWIKRYNVIHYKS
ncbi:transposase [Terrisporobacter petrolearius]|uniref:transposase n=1 Tax=Terrisporobacter petrolearius TaxID=1460447 RepID=UPI001D15F131|nr:transposase [Terrisporobacter petrolearius]MCC3863595.1 transposase [Terrisporobacter petrolearius]